MGDFAVCHDRYSTGPLINENNNFHLLACHASWPTHIEMVHNAAKLYAVFIWLIIDFRNWNAIRCTVERIPVITISLVQGNSTLLQNHSQWLFLLRFDKLNRVHNLPFRMESNYCREIFKNFKTYALRRGISCVHLADGQQPATTTTMQSFLVWLDMETGCLLSHDDGPFCHQRNAPYAICPARHQSQTTSQFLSTASLKKTKCLR